MSSIKSRNNVDVHFQEKNGHKLIKGSNDNLYGEERVL
jgi:hypothetical protein